MWHKCEHKHRGTNPLRLLYVYHLETRTTAEMRHDSTGRGNAHKKWVAFERAIRVLTTKSGAGRRGTSD